MITNLAALVVAVCLPASAAAPSPAADAQFALSLAGIRTQVAAGVAANPWNEERALLELLRDADPEVRRQAVRSLKPYVSQRMSTRDSVLDVYRNGREDLAVRLEAAKTLSAVTGYPVVIQVLLDGARRGDEDSLRAISYKALYIAAAERAEVRDALLDAARGEREPAVRLGAIWALFNVNDTRAKDGLLEIAQRDRDEAAQAEAIKSLYGLMVYPDVRNAAFDLARDPRTPSAVRRGAILLHANRVNSAQNDLLQDIARGDRDPQMRAAAIVALGNPRSEELMTFFHLVRRDHNGVMIGDPLDAQ